MNRQLVGTLFFGLFLFAARSAPGAISVDGDLSDWGIISNTSNDTQTYSAGISNANASTGGTRSSVPLTIAGHGTGTLHYHAEDYSSGLVGPGSGGQNYDAEFLGAIVFGTDLYLAISSGQRPDNGSSLYGPGDIRMEVNGVMFGIEVGGGYGGGAGTTVNENSPGRTYILDGGGHTTSSAVPPDADQTAGSLWAPGTWISENIFGDPSQIQITSGTELTMTDYAFSRNSISSQHSYIEVKIDLNVILNKVNSMVPTVDTVDELHFDLVRWSPACGNDVVDIEFSPPQTPPGEVPEPISFIVWGGLGLAAVLGRRYGRGRKRQAERQ
jgi:hypothetical protein